MATSINLRINDGLEQKLKEKVEEIKKDTPLGAEVNNSTVVRGALIEFFNKIDKEKAGERNVNFNFSKLSDEDLKEMSCLFQFIFKSMEDFKHNNEKIYFEVWRIINSIDTELLEEMLKRKNSNKNNAK